MINSEVSFIFAAACMIAAAALFSGMIAMPYEPAQQELDDERLVPGIVARRTDRLFLAVAEPILKIHRHAETTAGLKLAKQAVAAIMVNARKQILHRLVIKLWEV